ncbi:MAG TPA: hypothetical protein VHC97_21710 [Thermoanaerobaculia bacterium]|jgi:hypothetical protein|nr:hypothetical protein [Thermoanaerobaculia bacterium]
MEAEGRPQKKPTSPWVYVGCGCGALVLLAMMGLAGLTWWGYRTGKEYADTLTDPQKRTAKVRSVLPYDSLPEGYHPAFAISMPMGFMDMAMFTDRDPGTGEKAEKDQGFDERGFLYMSMRQVRDNKAKMERYLRGETPRPEDSGWAQTDVRFNAKENVRRGTVTVNGTRVLYSANRGEVSRQGKADKDGLVTMVMPQCPDSRMRFAMWFGPDPAPEKPVAEADFTGTNADPAAIEEFLGHFKLCGK